MTGESSILELADRLDREQQEEDVVLETPETWVSFAVGGLGFALPVGHLRGAHRIAHITPVPRAPAGLRGLSNLRGRVRPVVDLGEHLGLGPVALTESSRILEVEIGDRLLGLLVERAEHLTKIFRSHIEPLDSSADPAIGARATGMHEAKNGSVILLDPTRLLSENGMQEESS